jgi:hypothetical protein
VLAASLAQEATAIERQLPDTSERGHSSISRDCLSGAHPKAPDQALAAKQSTTGGAPAAEEQQQQGGRSASAKLEKRESGPKGAGAAVELEMVDVEVVSE